jgi:hypothetical protein
MGLLLRKISQRETPEAQGAEEAPGPPAVSERLLIQLPGKFSRAYYPLTKEGKNIIVSSVLVYVIHITQIVL